MPIKVVLLTAENSPVAVQLIREFQSKGIPLAGIVVDEKKLSQMDLLRYCDRTGQYLKDIELLTSECSPCPLHIVSSHNDESAVRVINEIRADILVNAGTPRILKKQILTSATLGAINCHPGILPHFRGCSCVEWAIFLDEKIGNTVHWMVEEIDNGSILSQQELIFSKADTYTDIRSKVYNAGFQLLASTVENLLSIGIEKKEAPGNESGRYFKPMPDNLLEIVKLKIKSGKYKYQL